MPLRSYLKSAEAGEVLAGKRFAAYVVCRRYWSINLKEVRKLGAAQGGAYAGGTRFQFAGGQIRSLLSLISYFGTGEMRERYLGVKIPPTNLKPDFAGQAQGFANKLADSLDAWPHDDGRDEHVSDQRIDRTELAIRRPPFRGVVKRTLDGSQPDWNYVAPLSPPGGCAEHLADPHRRCGLWQPGHLRRADPRAGA